MCVCVKCQSAHVEVRGQAAGLSFLHRFQELNSGCQACWQVPSPLNYLALWWLLCASRVTHTLFHTPYFVILNSCLSSLEPSFCSYYSISFVEDCQCLAHHYSNSTIIKSEEGLRLLSTRMTGIHHHTWLYYVRSTCLASICSSCTIPLEFSQTSSQQRQNHVSKTSLKSWRDGSDLLFCREEHGGSSRKPEFDSQHPYGGS